MAAHEAKVARGEEMTEVGESAHGEKFAEDDEVLSGTLSFKTPSFKVHQTYETHPHPWHTLTQLTPTRSMP